MSAGIDLDEATMIYQLLLDGARVRWNEGELFLREGWRVRFPGMLGSFVCKDLDDAISRLKAGNDR